MTFQMKIYISIRIGLSKISEANGIIGLSVWNCFRYQDIMLATSTKNCIFIFISTSVWWVTKVSYELFLVRCFDLHKAWKCFMTFTAFSQTSIAGMATCSSQPSVSGKTTMGKHPKCPNECIDLFELGNRRTAATWLLKLFPISSDWFSWQSERLRAPHVVHSTQYQ